MDASEGLGCQFKVPPLSGVTRVRRENILHSISEMNFNRHKSLSLKTIRRIVDLRDWYYLATEELRCSNCNKAFLGWDFQYTYKI